MEERTGDPDEPAGEDPSVLASLRATRPARLSRRARAGGDAPAAAPRKAGPRPSADRPADAAPGGAEASVDETPTAAGAQAAADKARPARSGPAATSASDVTPLAPSERSRPRAVRAGHPTLEEPGEKAAHGRGTADADAEGAGLIRTLVQAAGELASIGATVGAQVVKRALDRLPPRS